MAVYLTTRDKYLATETEPERSVFARCFHCHSPIYAEDDEFCGDEYMEVVVPSTRDVVIICTDCSRAFVQEATYR